MVAQSGWLFVFDVFGCFSEEFLDLENVSKKNVLKLGDNAYPVSLSWLGCYDGYDINSARHVCLVIAVAVYVIDAFC